jgi:hypothetical protein
MKHNPEVVLLGSKGSSDADVSCEAGDPSTFKAGLAVRRASTGLLSLTSGGLIGISLGRSLSDTSKTSVVRAGNLIPIQLTDEEDEGEEIGPYDYVAIGASVDVDDTTGKAVSDGVATGAIYVSGPKIGIDPITKEEIMVALVDMGGGL